MKAAAESLGQGMFGVILADPPWRFEPYSRQTGMDRAADNHYPTMDVDAIAALEVPAADDCALFLWATAPMIREALFVMSAWGFEYKSQLIWLKDRLGTGYWARNKHEILLIGTRGDIPAPAPGTQPESVIAATVGAHSEKPVAFHEIIECIYPNLPRLEMFARASRPGWKGWGAEAEAGRFNSGSLTEIAVKTQVQVLPDVASGDVKGGPTGMGRSDGRERPAPNSNSSVPTSSPEKTDTAGGKVGCLSPSATIPQRKPLRPHCLNPDLCAGSGREHCHACKKAMASEAA
ncbi:hypothetical protein FJ980_30245 [Mesorhizobium sp. B1-1-5]|nr:hypothetical protein FJ980_30245 [Mesorhizobium sp. B1-1-5]